MGLSAEETAQLKALQEKEQAASDDDEFDSEEIEVWNEKGAGARLRGKHSRAWLIDNGFLKVPDAAPANDSGNDNGSGGTGNTRKSKGPAAKSGTAGRYFGTSKTGTH